MVYFDAHCHLQDERIRERLSDILDAYAELGVRRVVVNGTKEGDWDQVAQLAEAHEMILPSFGLHPWEVTKASDGWKSSLEGYVDRFPGAGVGEIGFDRWMEDYDIDAQREAFHWQVDLAAERNLPVSIHCLQAWGILDEALRERELPERGVLIHSFGGSLEMANALADLGAYFSVSGYFAQERKQKQWEVIRSYPKERLLVETDAPDMIGPERTRDYRFEDDSLNHPGNIAAVYRFVAETREEELEALAERVGKNFAAFFE